ncbi:pimeloyl-ACP methyl ester carboxylesterase [Mumia flava]|uniref:Pimeloyl-ACP methyl ester carboxylesterase n=1 Tax=Mumia flava TaxID=1348852 RepID=A0A2M9B799_9ACTN|nr:alpha/beta fold hydrolase [Mumia flava]PJJ53830.1 pimeloyl-ACP methyl ester carboxylesterase [Mumia flava]
MERATDPALETRWVTVHGHRRAYRLAGDGPVLLLLHGLGCDSSTWLPVMGRLAERYTVLAPDFLGHGASDKPRADYSLGGYANGMRDLLACLDLDRATVVGHSLGGGVAMQFAYQFPKQTERLCLVAPGGLGPEVSPLIRALTLPGAGVGLGLLSVPPVRAPLRRLLRGLSRTGIPHTRDLDEVADVYAQLCDPAARAAIRAVTSHVIDWRGQRVTMHDRAYLAESVPLCLVWGACDDVIPARHATLARREAGPTRVEIFPRSGHFPHKDEPELFVEVLSSFVDQQPAVRYRKKMWRSALQAHGAVVEDEDEAEDAAPQAG